jgi:hypothetical protein
MVVIVLPVDMKTSVLLWRWIVMPGLWFRGGLEGKGRRRGTQRSR